MRPAPSAPRVGWWCCDCAFRCRWAGGAALCTPLPPLHAQGAAALAPPPARCAGARRLGQGLAVSHTRCTPRGTTTARAAYRKNLPHALPLPRFPPRFPRLSPPCRQGAGAAGGQREGASHAVERPPQRAGGAGRNRGGGVRGTGAAAGCAQPVCRWARGVVGWVRRQASTQGRSALGGASAPRLAGGYTR